MRVDGDSPLGLSVLQIAPCVGTNAEYRNSAILLDIRSLQAANFFAPRTGIRGDERHPIKPVLHDYVPRLTAAIRAF